MPKATKDGLKSESSLFTSSKEEYVPTFESVEKARIWRAIDIRLLPFVTLLYLMSFL
jgi:hypothetical protein